MKTVSERYSRSHEWAQMHTTGIRIGISDYAQQNMGDIVFIELPKVGGIFKKGERFGVIESVKTASDVYAPVGGTVIEINRQLAEDPGLINRDAIGTGWLATFAPLDADEMNTLMPMDEYTAYLDGIEKIEEHE